MAKFLKVIPGNEVLDLFQQFPALPTEVVSLEAASGRVLAAAVIAGEDVPGFARATMDGYAVRARDTFGATETIPALLEIAGKVEMGEVTTQTLEPGKAIGIPTGGMIPPGADAVVMVEFTQLLDAQTIEVAKPVTPGENVLQVGEDLQAGVEVLKASWRLRPQDVGVLAALGKVEVEVHRRPRVAIISTGDEIVPVATSVLPLGKTRDINSYALAAQAQETGVSLTLYDIVVDDLPALQAACLEALRGHDVVLLSGGSSVGARDFTIQVLEGLPEAEVLFHGIAIRPGKPTILARVGSKLFWGLPGQPVSAMIVFTAFVRPLLARLEGQRIGGISAGNVRRAVLNRRLPSVHGRADYLRVVLAEQDGRLLATPVFGKSAMISTLSHADGYVVVPEHVEGCDQGSTVTVHLF
jgi:molybdopterin molybdotransferase